MTLQYPSDSDSQDMDYVTFSPSPYRTNNTNTGLGGSAAPASASAHSVVLYMPNSTPAVGNANAWSEIKFEGPLGQLKKDGAAALGEAGAGLGNMGVGRQNNFSISEIGQRVTANLKGAGGAAAANLGGIAAQVGMQAMSGIVGASPNQMLALGAGKVYNPNVELLYSSPQMRSFAFNFDMTPKSAQEAQMINRIILNFKKWSAPDDLENGMFEVPYVWKIEYKTGTGINKNMNQFKKAALSSISVQANANTEMHVAHAGGVPITTSITLQFQEVDIIVRGDHTKAGGQGF